MVNKRPPPAKRPWSLTRRFDCITSRKTDKPFCKMLRNWLFQVLVLQKTAVKCTKVLNERADPLFCSLSLLSGDLLVAVAVMF